MEVGSGYQPYQVFLTYERLRMLKKEHQNRSRPIPTVEFGLFLLVSGSSLFVNKILHHTFEMCRTTNKTILTHRLQLKVFP